MDAPITAVYDACVLYSAPVRDLLMHVAVLDLVRARWTREIHEEWISNLLENRPDLSRARLDRTRKLMDQNVRGCLVTGYKHLIPGLELPDSRDRHVLAAAIHAQADVIVTFNLADFPRDSVGQHRIRAVHPDELICALLDSHESDVCLAVQRQRLNLKNPSVRVDELLLTLKGSGLPASADRLTELKASL